MDTELGYSKNDVTGNNSGNSRNGSYKKTLKSELGAVELAIPCDRNGEFVSNVTNRIMPLVSEWKNRPLEST